MTNCRCYFLPVGKPGTGSPISERFVGAVREPPPSTLRRFQFTLWLTFKLCVSSLDEAPVTSVGPVQAQHVGPRRRSGRLHNGPPLPPPQSLQSIIVTRASPSQQATDVSPLGPATCNLKLPRWGVRWWKGDFSPAMPSSLYRGQVRSGRSGSLSLRQTLRPDG